MPQSLANVLVHLVFSTKNRAPLLDPAIRAQLYPYLSGTLRNHQSNAVQVGGMDDHVHILATLPRTMTVAQMAEKVKSGSSKWISEKWGKEFAWQTGYGAFSVGIREVEQMTGIHSKPGGAPSRGVVPGRVPGAPAGSGCGI